MRMAGHVALAEERRGVYRVLVGKLREGDPLGNLGIDGRKILRWIFRKWDVGLWTGLSWLRIGTDVGTCECDNEPSDSIQCVEFPGSMLTS
jgi:hypothetical protein